MKNTKDFTTIIMEKKATLEILEELMEKLGDIENYARKDWGKVGTKQATKYCDDQGKRLPVYIDSEGNETFEITDEPKMVDDYDYIEKEEFSDRDRAKLAAIDKIRETLASLA